MGERIHSQTNAAVAAASALRPALLAARNETEDGRQLPDSIVASLVESQLYRLALPSELGGLELDSATALKVYEELGAAEASAAWVVWNSSLPCYFARFLPEATRAEIFGERRFKYGSSTRPTGRATADGGDAYRIEGRWSLVSGCTHADWLVLACLEEEKGQLKMSAMGGPVMRLAFVPKGSFEIIDTWRVGGLRGTASHDVAVKDLFVPAVRTFTPMDKSRMDTALGRIPISCTMAVGHAALCLGICRTAVERVIELGKTKVSPDPSPDLRERSSNQVLAATATAKATAWRAHLHAVTRGMWEKPQEGSESTAEDLADIWSAAVTAGREFRSIVADAYAAAGTTALYTDCVVERGYRDIGAAMQHMVIQELWLQEAGRVKFGLEPTSPLYADLARLESRHKK